MRFVYLVIFLALTGCASGNVKTQFSLQDAQAKGHGLLIGSLSVAAYDSVYSMTAKYFLIPAADIGKYSYLPGTHIEVTTGCDNLLEGDSDFLDVCAHLFIVDLPAGDYVLSGWAVDSDTGGHFGPAHNGAPSDKWVPVKFTIQAGKATYVGDLHMGVITIDSIPGVHGGWPFLHDEHARDIPKLEQKYPTLNDGNVIVELLDFQPTPEGLRYLDVPSPRPPPVLPRHKP